MRYQTRLSIITVVTFIFFRSVAQNTEIGGVFPTIDHSGTLSEKWDYSIYYFGAFNLINPPVSGLRENPYLGALYLEQALQYKVNKLFTLTGSYVYERQNALKKSYRNENRYYLQATIKYLVNKVHVKHRIRYDGRYIENRVTEKIPYTHRLRYLTGLSVPFKKKENLYFAAYNEFFLNLDKGAAPIYNENWAFAGVGLKTKKTGTWEAGPLYIFWALPGLRNDLINFYYFQLAWVTHLDFRKTKPS